MLKEVNALPIEEEVEIQDKFPSPVERYFTSLEKSGVTGLNDDYRILVHSNKVHVVTLAPTHELIKSNKIPVKVDFQVRDNVDRLNNHVQGKSKKGAQTVHPPSVIMKVETEDGTLFFIRAATKGKLLEVNEKLLQNPKLLVEEPCGRGYVAIVLPFLSKNYHDNRFNNDEADS